MRALRRLMTTQHTTQHKSLKTSISTSVINGARKFRTTLFDALISTSEDQYCQYMSNIVEHVKTHKIEILSVERTANQHLQQNALSYFILSLNPENPDQAIRQYRNSYPSHCYEQSRFSGNYSPITYSITMSSEDKSKCVLLDFIYFTDPGPGKPNCAIILHVPRSDAKNINAQAREIIGNLFQMSEIECKEQDTYSKFSESTTSSIDSQSTKDEKLSESRAIIIAGITDKKNFLSDSDLSDLSIDPTNQVRTKPNISFDYIQHTCNAAARTLIPTSTTTPQALHKVTLDTYLDFANALHLSRSDNGECDEIRIGFDGYCIIQDHKKKTCTHGKAPQITFRNCQCVRLKDFVSGDISVFAHKVRDLDSIDQKILHEKVKQLARQHSTATVQISQLTYPEKQIQYKLQTIRTTPLCDYKKTPHRSTSLSQLKSNKQQYKSKTKQLQKHTEKEVLRDLGDKSSHKDTINNTSVPCIVVGCTVALAFVGSACYGIYRVTIT